MDLIERIVEDAEAKADEDQLAVHNAAVVTCIELVEHYFAKRSSLPAPFGYAELIHDLEALKQ